MATLALIGESRGEFLFLRHVADRVRAVLGPGAVVEIEMDPDDLLPEERRTCLIPVCEPEFAEALAIPDADLVTHVREAEQELGIPNLRPLWRTDILSWRQGEPDGVMARRAIGYLRVFERLFRETPDLVGGFAEDGGRLVKRCFRWVSLAHGARMVIALPMPMSNRLLFVEQEDYALGLPSYEDFEPTPEAMAEATTRVQHVLERTVQLSRPRELSFGVRRVRNFARLAYRQFLGGASSAAYLPTFARDYGYQRAQLSLLDRFADRQVPADPAVFYPVHVAQDTQMAIRGAPYMDQPWLIAYLARSLPFGCQLWVKPHPAAPGEVSAAGLLRMRRTFGNMRILHPSVHAHDVLRRASAMVTVNSTTGFEALMFGVPVVTLGGSVYRGRGLTSDVYDPADLPSALAKAVGGVTPDRQDVLKLFAYCLTYSHELAPSYVDASRENGFRFADALLAEFGLACTAASHTADRM